MSQIILNGLTTGQLKELLVEAISELLGSTLQPSNKDLNSDQSKYLTRVEAAKLLQISLPTLHDYTKRGLISSYRIGSNVRYKPSDLDSALSARNYSLNRKGGKRA